jgi:hypothetical protein
MADAMAVERRARDRRTMPSEHLDVTRLEHENLCRQMDEVLRMLRRFETELHAQSDRIAALENGSVKRNGTG